MLIEIANLKLEDEFETVSTKKNMDEPVLSTLLLGTTNLTVKAAETSSIKESLIKILIDQFESWKTDLP